MFQLNDASTVHQSPDDPSQEKPLAQMLTVQDWQTASASLRHSAQVAVLCCLVPPLELQANQQSGQTMPFPAGIRPNGFTVYGPFNMIGETLASSQLNSNNQRFSDDQLAAFTSVREAANDPGVRQAVKRILAEFSR